MITAFLPLINYNFILHQCKILIFSMMVIYVHTQIYIYIYVCSQVRASNIQPLTCYNKMFYFSQVADHGLTGSEPLIGGDTDDISSSGDVVVGNGVVVLDVVVFPVVVVGSGVVDVVVEGRCVVVDVNGCTVVVKGCGQLLFQLIRR